MIIWRWNNRMHGGRVEVYPRALSEDWFFFFSVLWYLATEAFGGGKNYDSLSFYLSLPPFFSPFWFLEGLLCYISPSHWSWLSICWSYRSLLECLSHPPPSSTCCELQQTKWYYLGVISSLMRPDCQLRAFNTKVTVSPKIALSTIFLWLAHWARNFLWDARGDYLWRHEVFPFHDFSLPRTRSSSVVYPGSLDSLCSSSGISSSFPLGRHFSLYISFSMILAIHLLIIQVATGVSVPSTTFLNLLWVTANKVVLFRGHFFINAAKLSAVGI